MNNPTDNILRQEEDVAYRKESTEQKYIRVKFVNRGQLSANPPIWLRQFPGKRPVWGNCEFIFDPNERNYDWLVVENDLPAPEGKPPRDAIERLNCPREHTLFITREPSSVTTYGSRFLNQFTYVLTGQEDWALKHSGKIHSQPALRWYYGDTSRDGGKNLRDLDWIVANPPLEKTKTISTMCSAKAQKHTMHYDRVQFVEKLQIALPEMDRFGEGFKAIPDKAASLNPYKYHITIENHFCPHWWTEKLADAFLGLCLPFYHGAPNASDYFPADSFIPINIHDFESSLQIIKKAIDEDAYSQRLNSIKAARDLVIYKYNTFSVVAEIIEQRNNPQATSQTNLTIQGKHALRKNPIAAAQIGIEKVYLRAQTLLRKHGSKRK